MKGARPIQITMWRRDFDGRWTVCALFPDRRPNWRQRFKDELPVVRWRKVFPGLASAMRTVNALAGTEPRK